MSDDRRPTPEVMAAGLLTPAREPFKPFLSDASPGEVARLRAVAAAARHLVHGDGDDSTGAADEAWRDLRAALASLDEGGEG